MAKRKGQTQNNKKVTIEIRHDFTAEEYKEKTGELTRTMQRVEEKEAAVKAAAAVAKAEIKELKANVNEMANQLQNGYEMRSVSATVEYNRSKAEKSFYLHSPGKPDNNKFVRKEAMTQEDYQELPLEENDKTAETVKGPGRIAFEKEPESDNGSAETPLQSEGDNQQ